MEILLNGEKYEIIKEKITIQELLDELSQKWKLDLSGAVVLINDNIIKKSEWNKQKIDEDCEVEVLSFVSGG